MIRQFNGNSLALLLFSCLLAAESGASPVPYDHDLLANEGMKNSRSQRENLFGSLPRSIVVKHEESQYSPWQKEYHSLWNRHPGHEYLEDDDRDSRYGHPGHGIRGDDHRDLHSDSWYGDRDSPHDSHPDWHHFPHRPCTSPVPVPAALWLFLSGIIGMGLMGRSHRR